MTRQAILTIGMGGGISLLWTLVSLSHSLSARYNYYYYFFFVTLTVM
jgi:hypothetical protein